jgi:hypothetical protein
MHPSWFTLAAALHPTFDLASAPWDADNAPPLFPTSALGASAPETKVGNIALRHNRAIVAATTPLLAQWQAAGAFDHPIEVHLSNPEFPLSFAEVHAHTEVDGRRPHQLFVHLNEQGEIHSFLRDATAELAKSSSTPLFRYALMMAHEAGHTAYRNIWSPFQPSENFTALTTEKNVGRVKGHDLIQAIEDTILGPCATNPFDPQLEETFADVYGALLVLRTSEGNEQAWAEVRLWTAVREANHAWFLNNAHSPAPVIAWSDPAAVFTYDTAPALRLMMERSEQWARLPLSALPELALNLVSDAWLIQLRQQLTVDPYVLEPLLNVGHNRFANRLNVAATEGRLLAFLAETAPALGHHPVYQAWARVSVTPGLDAQVAQINARMPSDLANTAQEKAATDTQRNVVMGELLNKYLNHTLAKSDDDAAWHQFEKTMQETVKALQAWSALSMSNHEPAKKRLRFPR